MAQDIGPKISLEGEKEYRNSLKNIIAESKALGSEMKALESSFDENTSAEEKMAKKSELLNRQIENQQKYVDQLKAGLQKCTEQYGEGSTEVYNYQTKVNKAQTVLNSMETELRGMTTEVENTTDAMEEGSEESSVFADNLKANLLSEAITKGFDMLANAAKKVAGAFKDAVVDSAAYADSINTLSVTTGLSTDTLQEYQYMADLADVSLNTITGSLTKLTRNMQNANSGNEAMSDKFKALGVAVTDADGNLRSAEEVFNDTLEALSGIENQTERDATAMEIFGKSAQDLNPLMAIGAEGINALKQEAHDTGYVLDSETLSSLNSVQDAMDRWSNATTTLSNKLGAALAPAISDIADKVTKFVTGGGLDKCIDTFQKWLPVIVGVTTAIGALAIAMNFSTISANLIGCIEKVQGAFTALFAAISANPFMLVIGLIAGLVAAFVTAYMTSDTFREKVNNAFAKVKEAVVNAWENIKAKWDACTSFFSNIASSITNTFTNLKNSALGWGRDLIDNMVAGIKAKISSVVNAVSGVAGKIASFLHFSEPDVGPLSNFNSWMPDMMSQMAEQIERGRGMVQSAVQNVASDIALPIGTSNTLNYGGTTINVYGAEGQSVDDLAEIIQSKLDADVRRKAMVFA